MIEEMCEWCENEVVFGQYLEPTGRHRNLCTVCLNLAGNEKWKDLAKRCGREVI